MILKRVTGIGADIKRAARRRVEEISEEDYLFSLDVKFFGL